MAIVKDVNYFGFYVWLIGVGVIYYLWYEEFGYCEIGIFILVFVGL